MLARLLPDQLDAQLTRLWALDYHDADSEAVLQHAGRLAVALNHHLFDTLYHAAALSQPDAVLVTADERYFGKAAALGRIVRLRDWPAPQIPQLDQVTVPQVGVLHQERFEEQVRKAPAGFAFAAGEIEATCRSAGGGETPGTIRPVRVGNSITTGWKPVG